MKKIAIALVFLLAFCQLFADDDEKLKLAVMDFEDLSGKLSADTLAGASEYFRITFAQTNRYIIISKDRQKSQISDMRKKYNTDPSYKSCTDKNCQIQLGQALSADLILKTSVSFFAGFYTLASELIDLEKEATIIAATEEYDGSPKELRAAIKKLVDKIVEAEKRENGELSQPAPAEKKPVVQAVVEKEPASSGSQSKDLRDCEAARNENSITAWKAYLRKYSKGECSEEAHEKLDKMSCAEAEKENSLKAWKQYRKDFKDGICDIKAEENIKRLEEEENARLAEEANSIYTKADERLDDRLSKRFTFDIGLGTNEGADFGFGMGIGFDFDWKVFSKPYGAGAGNLFVGFGLDFQYWLFVEFAIPVQLNIGYEFKLNNPTLRYVGFWYSMGVNLNFLHQKYSYDWDDDGDNLETFSAGFAYELYVDMIFASRFTLNVGMAGVAGTFLRTSFILGLGCVF